MLSFFHAFGRVLPFALVLAVVPAAAQDYPSRPVTIVVGYTPGATSDLVARTIGERLNAAWGQSVIVDNRSGVGGNIAAAYVARAQPDGYTLMVGTDAMMTTNVYLYKNAPFDPVKDFSPVIYAGANIICLAVNTEFPANSVADVIAYAKANPGKLSYSSAGVGSASHLAGELLKTMAGIDMVHVPNKGMNPALIDLMGGQVQVLFASVPGMLSERSERLRPIAMAERKRSALLPDLPTIDEQGLKGFEVGNWAGLLAPAGLDPAIVKKVHGEIMSILATPDVKDRIKTLGYDEIGSTPEDFAAQVKNDVERWSEVVKRANVPMN